MRVLRIVGVLAAVVSAAVAGAEDGTELEAIDTAFDSDVLVLVASQHACHRVDIYLALTLAQQRRGLMFVRDLPPSSGMLFVYDRERPRSMWMKNTFVPLDIAFAHADGRIANVARSTEPQSLRSIRSAAPVQYVLELNAGVADRLSIDENSRILWGPIFDTQSSDERP